MYNNISKYIISTNINILVYVNRPRAPPPEAGRRVRHGRSHGSVFPAPAPEPAAEMSDAAGA